MGEGVQGMPGSGGGLQPLVQELEGSERALASTLPHVAPLSFAAHLSAQLAGSARERQDEVLREFPRVCCLAALQDGCEEAWQRFARLLRLRRGFVPGPPPPPVPAAGGREGRSAGQ